MKKRSKVHLFLSILEGMLSGGYFYLGKRDKEPLSILTGCMWLACSFFHGLLSIQEDDNEDFIMFMEETEDD